MNKIKISLAGKLNLNKKVVTVLEDSKLTSVLGGRAAFLAAASDHSSCDPTEAGASSPCNPQTCSGSAQATCIYINGC